MVVYLEMLVLSGWILVVLPADWNWDVEIQVSGAGNLVQRGETREIYNILIPAQFNGSFKYTCVDQITRCWFVTLDFLHSPLFTSVFWDHVLFPLASMPAQVFTCCDLSISLVLLNLFSLKSETSHEITNHVIMILLSVTFYLRGDLTLRGLEDNQEKISSPQISFVLWMLKLLDCGIWKARHSQHLDILFCAFTLNFYMVSNIAEWSGCKTKLV